MQPTPRPEPSSPTSAAPKPARSLRQRFVRLAPFFAASRGALLLALLATLLGAATEPLVPAMLKPLLDNGFVAGALPLWWVPMAIIGLFALRGAAGFVAQYALSWAAQRAAQNLRRSLFAHLLAVNPQLFAQQSASRLTNTVVYEVQMGTTVLVAAVLTLFKDSFTLIALLGYLFWLNWKLTLFVALLFPAVALAMRSLGRRLQKVSAAGQAATDELAYVVEENTLAWKSVRLHQAQAQQAQRFERSSDTLRRLVLKGVAASAAMTPITQFFAACALSAVIVVALMQTGSGGASVGSFVAFITAMLMLVAPLKHLSDAIAPITRGLVAVERGLDMMVQQPLEQTGQHQCDRARGAIEWRDCSLRYREDAHPALDGVTLTVSPGEIVALVGPSGAGKTSLVHTLPRFVGVDQGTIHLDGVALPAWDLASLRAQLAFVSQEVVLFSDTVAYNVALGAQPDDARVEQALRAAHLWAHVQSLPQGMQTQIGHNGRELSGGQRQRLAIARALYKDAPVLVLDEATSALDSESERAVQSALDELMKGRTTLVIAHRLSTIEHAHRVVVMDRGCIVEQGPHERLLASGGLYARLHAMQFGGSTAAAPAPGTDAAPSAVEHTA
jgi:subfamily B ATP-binding cassette protein MsbA